MCIYIYIYIYIYTTYVCVYMMKYGPRLGSWFTETQSGSMQRMAHERERDRERER